VRVIQGDGVDKNSIVAIMDAMMARSLAIGNIAFGMGGGLLQKLDRDCFGCAMKTSANFRDSAWHDVFKELKIAGGAKRSKRGRQGALLTDFGKIVACRADDIPAGCDLLVPVFRDGEILRFQDFSEIRARAWPGVPGFDAQA
jgi:nicotinamide phosphoribosyltransferase